MSRVLPIVFASLLLLSPFMGVVSAQDSGNVSVDPTTGIIQIDQSNSDDRKVSIIDIDGATRVVYARWYQSNDTAIIGIESSLTRTVTITDSNDIKDTGAGHVDVSRHTVQRGKITYIRVDATAVSGGDQTITIGAGENLVFMSDEDTLGGTLVDGPFNDREAQLILGTGAIMGLGTLVLIIRRKHKKALKEGVIRR